MAETQKWSAQSAITSPDDADYFSIVDNSATENKKLTWAYLKAAIKSYLNSYFPGLAESETVSGEWTFSTFPITPSAAPDADYEVANKKYVDDNVGDATVSGGTEDNLVSIAADESIQDSGYAASDFVETTGDETIAGKKTFSTFPETPSAAPTTDYQASNKKYVDDNASGLSFSSGNNAAMEEGNTIDVSHAADTNMQRIVLCTKEVDGEDTDQNTIDMDAGDESLYTQFNCQQTAVNFQVDTANTSGHFEDSGNTPVTVGSGNTCPYIQAGVRFKFDGDDTIYEVTAVTDDGEADDEIEFTEQDGSAATKATGTYAVDYVYGTEFDSGNLQLNQAGAGAEDAYTNSTNKDDTGQANTSWRTVIPAAQVSKSGTKIRITLEGHSSSQSDLDNVGFGIQAGGGNDWDTVDTPTEILFSGGSGVEISGGTTEVSDWVDFDFDAADSFVAIFDIASTNGNIRRDDTDSSGKSYYQAATDSYNVAAPAGFAAYGDDDAAFVVKVEVQSTAHPINQIYPTKCPQLTSDYWTDLNSGDIDETLNTETTYVCVSFDGGTTYGIWDDTGGDDGLRPIARNNGGTWQYNSEVTAGATDVTWTNSTIDSELGAISQAFGIAANQLTGAEFDAITDSEWNDTSGSMNGFEPGTTETVDTVVALYSDTATNTPTVTSVTYNYLSTTYWEDCDIHDPTEWVLYKYSSNTVLEKVGSGTSNVKVQVGL